MRPVLAAVPAAPDRHVRVTVLGAPGPGRTAALAAIHRVLTRGWGLWMHLPDPGALRDSIALRRAQEGEAVPASAARRNWTFHLADGTDPVLKVDWLEADTDEGDGAPPVGGAVRPSPAAPQRCRPSLTGYGTGRAQSSRSTRPAHLVVPLDAGRAAVGEATGAHRADTVIQSAATFHRDRGTLPPLVVMLMTGAERLVQDRQPMRTREGLLADLRLLLPSAFSPGVLAALCPVSATGGEGGRPAGAEAPAWLLLLNRLRREADRLRQLAAAEGAEAQRLRQQAEER